MGTEKPGLIRQAWEWLDTRAALRTVQLGMVVSVISIGGLYVQDRQQADCMQRYNEATADVSRVRAEAADARAEALAEAMRASIGGPSELYRTEAQDYLDQYESEKRTRRENPLVAPPSDYCS